MKSPTLMQQSRARVADIRVGERLRPVSEAGVQSLIDSITEIGVMKDANLDDLRVGFRTSFQGGLGQAPSGWQRLSTVVPAGTKEVKYGWLGKIPNVREWIGPRAVQNLAQHDYSIREKKWELTIEVDRDDVETDNLGIYGPMFTEMGLSAGSTWDNLVFGLLADAFTTPCYDGQYFIDTDHPVLDAYGDTVSVSNSGGGAGKAWFLLDTTRAVKPIILQKRKDFVFTHKDKLTDDNVFDNNTFVYGCDARANVGFGFWQFAFGSRQTLDQASYAAARAALTGMKGDYGRPLGIRPNLLVVPSSLEGVARRLLNSEQINGTDNEWRGIAELMVTPGRDGPDCPPGGRFPEGAVRRAAPDDKPKRILS